MPEDPASIRSVPRSVAQLVDRARALASTGRRHILGITGAPGAGKSTLCAALEEALSADVAVVGMDGFHLAGRELARLGRADRKGAPDTFDVDGYVALLRRLRTATGSLVYAPLFDRGLEESIGSAVPVRPDTPLIITEGNYLLLSGPDWAPVRECLDEVWFLDVDPAERVRRLVARRSGFGHPVDEAQAWVREVDGRNAALVDPTRSRADLVVHLRYS